MTIVFTCVESEKKFRHYSLVNNKRKSHPERKTKLYSFLVRVIIWKRGNADIHSIIYSFIAFTVAPTHLGP